MERSSKICLEHLTENPAMSVTCSFASSNDFDNDDHLEVHPWTKATHDRCQPFVDLCMISPSGGDESEEGIAGSLSREGTRADTGARMIRKVVSLDEPASRCKI